MQHDKYTLESMSDICPIWENTRVTCTIICSSGIRADVTVVLGIRQYNHRLCIHLTIGVGLSDISQIILNCEAVGYSILTKLIILHQHVSSPVWAMMILGGCSSTNMPLCIHLTIGGGLPDVWQWMVRLSLTGTFILPGSRVWITGERSVGRDQNQNQKISTVAILY